jgi:hypothetical protein
LASQNGYLGERFAAAFPRSIGLAIRAAVERLHRRWTGFGLSRPE